MAILFPPIIESKIPAQAEYLKIYYTPNPMVTTFGTLAIKIKTISTNTEIITAYVDNLGEENNNYYFTYTPKEADFLQEDYSLDKGEFYKIQVAYVEEILTDVDKKKAQLQNLYWSSIGIFKWTKFINNWFINIDEYFNITSFYDLQDKTEPIHSYELKIINTQEYDSEFPSAIYQFNGLYSDSNPTAVKDKKLIEIKPNIDFCSGDYAIQLSVLTINGLKQICEEGNGGYRFNVIAQNNNIISSDKIFTYFNKNNLSYNIEINEGYGYVGTQIAKIENNHSIIVGAINDNGVFKDTAILPGEYIYSLKNAYTKNEETNTISYSYQNLNPILIDFEDMYLSDKDHLLCIRFNPKVSSFKENVLESKQDTIGGRYPFFFRNGNTRYKEFSINGLISYHMDSNETFLNRGYNLNINTARRQSTNAGSSTDLSFIPTTQLTGKNVYEEREFKLAVLEWLNNGKPKLFRSPTEGAYLVRLMNISLSPEDQLGRMLHSFQATAYEIDECTLENLRKYDCLYEEE